MGQFGVTMRPAMGRMVVTILVSALVSAGTYVVMELWVAPSLPVATVDVPPLGGLSPEQARGLLEPRGLLLVLDGERVDDRVPAGTIADQRPLGGSRLRKGDAVHADLARAGEPSRVPKLAGMTPDAAREALKAVKLRVGRTVDTMSADVARGLVVSSAPEAGAEMKPDTVVDLNVSAGPSTQPVPSVIGKSRTSAKALLEKAGFAVGATKYGSNDDYDQGVVIGQNPPAGAQASPGVKIDLTIND
jgi:eukaryotic-like serine/threonine-protein kinase